MRKPVTPDSARLKMADLCARSEQCEYDISQKLFKMGLPSSDIRGIINFLKKERFLDNYRYALSFARDKCRFSCWGPYKIRLALIAKRIPSTTIADALAEVENSDYEAALEKTAKNKAKNLDLLGDNAKEERIKLYRHILQRGFTSADASMIIKKTVHELRDQNK